MKITKTYRRLIRIFAIAILLLAAVAAGVLLREYLLLKRIEATLRQPAPQTKYIPQVVSPARAVPETPLVSAVTRSADGSLVRARADFSVFKKKVEAHPELLQQWGRLVWKIVGDIPALCVRNVGDDALFRPLGVKAGDCITHIDGETVNQPVRNMGIWLTLPARSRLKIDTLRAGKRISYELVRK